jgi:serine/threonine protein phosphatase PrpC
MWRVIGRSVRGASHVRANLPNQDAILWMPKSGEQVPLILAVSDGHGSSKCFRSDRGAKLAVQVAIEVLQSFLIGQPDFSNLSAFKRTAEERLPQEIVRKWKEAVQDEISSDPISSRELNALQEKDGAAARQAVLDDPIISYGATLLTVLVTESFIVYLQDGDGDILTVSETGEVSRPLSGDDRLFANETTSLCSHEAWRDFRIGFQALVNVPPTLILLSTDGYSNSFRDEENFLKVGSDLLEMIRSQGLNKVNGHLIDWLTEASRAGSGDDITLGIIKRLEDTDVDSFNRRLAACESGLNNIADQQARIDEQQKRLEDCEQTLKNMSERHKRNEQTDQRVYKLQWGFIVTLLLVSLSLALNTILWVRAHSTSPPLPPAEGLPSERTSTAGGNAASAESQIPTDLPPESNSEKQKNVEPREQTRGQKEKVAKTRRDKTR